MPYYPIFGIQKFKLEVLLIPSLQISPVRELYKLEKKAGSHFVTGG